MRIPEEQKMHFIKLTVHYENSSVVFLHKDRKGVFYGESWSRGMGMQVSKGQSDAVSSELEYQRELLGSVITIVDMIGKRLFSNSTNVSDAMKRGSFQLTEYTLHEVDTYKYYEVFLDAIFKTPSEPESTCCVIL